MAEKVTEMKLRVDLQCPDCYKKVKKILCKFPQIRDQVYDEKNNIVKIIVVCCNPEKIRDKLCCKGGKVIKSIEIVEPPKPKPKKPEHKPVPVMGPSPAVPVPVMGPSPADPVTPDPPPQTSLSTTTKKSNAPTPVHVQGFPIGARCPQCYGGHPGGPCYQGYEYGRLVPPAPCYDNYGYPYGYCYNRGFYVSRCDQYFGDENPSACSIM